MNFIVSSLYYSRNLVFLICYLVSSASSQTLCKGVKITTLGTPVITGILGNTHCIFNFTASLQKVFYDNQQHLKDLRISYALFVSNTTNFKPLLFTIKRHNENVKVFKIPFTYYEEPSSKPEMLMLPGSSKEWFYKVGGTLCYDQIIRKGSIENTQLIVKVSTENRDEQTEIEVFIQATRGLFLTLNNSTFTPVISPTISTYYGFDFNNTLNKNVKNVTIVVKSLVDNAPCTMMSFQNPLCPVQDTELTVLFEGKSQAFLQIGVEFIYRNEFEDREAYGGGFVMVLVVLSDDSKCKSIRGHASKHYEVDETERLNSFEIIALPSQWDTATATMQDNQKFYLWWILPLLASAGIPVLIVLLWILITGTSSKREVIPRRINYNTLEQFVDDYYYVDDLTLSNLPVEHADAHQGDSQHHFLSDTIVTTIHYFTALVIVIIFRIITLTETTDLSQCYYNKLCSYQFSTWYPFSLKFFMWNSVVSSSAFGISGIVYLVYLIYLKNKFWPGITIKHESSFPLSGNLESTLPTDEDDDRNSLIANQERSLNIGRVSPDAEESVTMEITSEHISYGVPEKFGLELALGGVLVLESILSAMYHVCPNFGSFLFDAPVMDLILILSWIRIHQLRYPNYMTTYWTTVIAITNILFELCLTLGHYKHQTNTILYITILCLKILYFNMLVLIHCFYIYQLGHYKVVSKASTGDASTSNLKNVTSLPQIFKIWAKRMQKSNDTLIRKLLPDRLQDFIPLCLIASVNTCGIWTLFILHTCSWESLNPETLLQITEYNIMFALATHLIRSFYYEGICNRAKAIPSLCLILHMVAHFVQLHFYDVTLFDWSLTHAESMNLNKPCWDDAYDYHDYYHFTKALSYFFLFMAITTSNDGSSHIRQEFIRIF